MISQAYKTTNFSSILKDLTEAETLLTKSSQYPPHNIVKVDDKTYHIELAVAGYSMEDLLVELNGTLLSISGEKPKIDESLYIHKGISSKKFIKEFTLAKDVVVADATLDNGLLIISLDRIIPEVTKCKTIPINGVARTINQLLNEDNEYFYNTMK